MNVQTYVATQSERGLAPLIDVAWDLLARDSRWRRVLAEQIAPHPRDVILDIGCGDGALALLLASAAPGADIIGVDPDEGALARARARAAMLGASLSLAHAPLHEAGRLDLRAPPTKVVVTLVGRHLSAPAQAEALGAAREALPRGGVVHVAHHSVGRRALVRRLLKNAFEGGGGLEIGPIGAAIRAAGFEAVEETARVPTASGSISLYRARAA